MKWLWGVVHAIGGILIISTWTVAVKSGAWDRTTNDVSAIKGDLKVTREIAEANKRELEGRKQTYDKMVEFYGSVSGYKFADWYEQHRQMYEMMLRGESNRARFYREHGYPAPLMPEGP